MLTRTEVQFARALVKNGDKIAALPAREVLETIDAMLKAMMDANIALRFYYSDPITWIPIQSTKTLIEMYLPEKSSDMLLDKQD